MLRIQLDFNLDISYKQCRFLKTLLKKDFEFVLSNRDSIIAFYLSFVLLLAKIDFILEEQDYKKDELAAYDTSCIKIIFALLIKVVIFYI